MARIPQFKVKETPKGWVVSMPKSMTATGERSRKYFPNKTAAQKFATESRVAYHEGIRGAMVPTTLALQAAEAEKILEGSGISIIEAARMAVSRMSTKQDAEKFSARYDRAILEGETRWSAKYALDMERLPRLLPDWFMDLPCGSIDMETMERALQHNGKKARSTLDQRIRMIRGVLGFRVRHRKSQTIHILSPDDQKALIDACEDAQERMTIGLLLYAGIRPDAEHGEISRLDWDAVGKKDIYVSPYVSKVGERYIPVTPSLRKMIDGHPKSGPVIPSNWKRKWSRLRKAANILVHDVTRHTFCSHMLAAFGMEKTQQAMGHVPMSQTTRRHYARAVKESDGKAYFGLE